MAALSQGIVGGEMAWPLVIVGIAMGIALILIKVRSPMLFSVGMYLPLETTFAIFMRRALISGRSRGGRRPGPTTRRSRPGWRTPGVLAASGLIAGEALIGLLIAAVIGWRADHRFPVIDLGGLAPWMALVVFAVLAWYLIYVPLTKAGDPDEPPPPTAVM